MDWGSRQPEDPAQVPGFGIELTLMSTEPSNKAASFPASLCHATMLVTCTLWAAGVLSA